MLGFASGCIPHAIARNLRNKFVPFPEFTASFAIAAALLVWITWGVLIVFTGAFALGWWALMVPFVMAFSQTFAYHYEDYFKEWNILNKYRKVHNKTQLEKQRQAIECLNIT